MAKIVILGDKHAGESDGNQAVMNHQLSCLDTVIEYCISNGITDIIQLGDNWEVKRTTNNNVASEWKLRYYDKLAYYGITEHTLIGNHDMYHKEKIFPNTTSNLLADHTNVSIHTKPSILELNGVKFGIMPWICEENYEESIKFIREADADVLCGHFEIKGARMESGVCEQGLEMSEFEHYKLVLSGHFHCRSEYDIIKYVGTPYDTKWSDYGEDKGFGVLDTETIQISYVNIEDKLHHKIYYREDKNMDFYTEKDYKGKRVRIIVEQRESYEKYETWLTKMELKGMLQMTVHDPLALRTEADSEVKVDVENLDMKDTSELFSEYVADVYPEKKTDLTEFVLGLHAEALGGGK